MRVINRHKEAVRNYLRADIRSNMTNIQHEMDSVRGIMSCIDQAAGGSVIGADQAMSGDAMRAYNELEKVMSLLRNCAQLVEQLDITEEDD